MFLKEQEESLDMADTGSAKKGHAKRKQNNPRIVLSQGQEDGGEALTPNSDTIKRQQRRRAKRRKRTRRQKSYGEDTAGLEGTAPNQRDHIFSDTELPAILLHRNSMSADGGARGGGSRYPESSGSACSTLSLPPMPLGGAPSRHPNGPNCGFGPLHNVPPPTHSHTSPCLQDRAQQPPHPFLKHRGVQHGDFKLKNVELGMSMYQSAKEMQQDDSGPEPHPQPRHLSDAFRVHLPSLTGLASGARLTLQ